MYSTVDMQQTQMTKNAELNRQIPARLVARHRAFYQRTPGQEALVGSFRHNLYPMDIFIDYLEEGQVQPEDLHVQDWLDPYLTAWRQTGLLWGEIIHWASPLNGFPWIEAILGCPIYASRDSRSVWAEAIPDEQFGRPIEFDPQNPWFRQLLSATQALVAFSSGRFPVASGIMRGVSDLLAAVLGLNRFYMDLYDDPERLKRWSFQLAALWIEVVKAQYEVIPPFQEGFVNAGLWLPDINPVYQEDAASQISGADFERAIGPATRQVLHAFPCPIIHLHSSGLQILPSILSLAAPPVIEVTLDPSGPSLESLLPTLREIQSRAPLQVFGTASQIERALSELEPSGLACLVLES